VKRMRVRIQIAIVAAAVVLCTAPSASSAAASSQSGWWTSAPFAAPDVPTGGLLLQGGPSLDQPVSFGAVSFALASGEKAGMLTLTVAASSATTPNATLTVCPLTKSFSPAEGGPKADGPTFDCGAKATASLSGDGHTFTVDAAAFARDGSVAVALLPTALTDRIVFDKPDGSWLSTSTSGPSSGPTALTTPPLTSAAPDAGASTGGRTPRTGTTPSATSGAAPAPRPTPAAQPAAAGSPTAPATPAVAVGAKAPAKRSSTLGFAFLALLVLMGALWLFAGNAHDETLPVATTAPSPEGASP